MTDWPRRRLGSALLVFGAVGLALLVTLALVIGLSLGGLSRAVTNLAAQRDEAIAMLEPAAAALDEAATSAEHAGTSLSSAGGAARQAAELMNQLAGAFDGLAQLGSFDVLGARPFGGLTGQFSGVAGQARDLSATLSTTAAALDANVTDSATVAKDLRTLADQLAKLRDSAIGTEAAATATDPETTGVLLRMALGVVLGVIAWLAVPAMVAIEIGRRWRRLPERATNRDLEG